MSSSSEITETCRESDAVKSTLGELADGANVVEQVLRIAKVLVRGAPGLGGFVGLDFQWHKGTAWLTEVNPRLHRFGRGIRNLRTVGRFLLKLSHVCRH